MNGNFKFLTAGLLVAIFLLSGAVGYQYFHQPKIAYVRSHDLIDKYQGTREARSAFEQRKNSMILNVDSLKIDFERQRNDYINSMNRLTAGQRTERERALSQQQAQVIRYSEAVEQKVAEEDSKMMQEVLNQINSFVEEFALREGYSFIFGTTLSGNLLYGEKTKDITDDLIKELNNRYKGK